MTSSFDNAISGALETLRSSCGQAVTFRRGRSSAELTAVVGKTAVSQDDGRGLVVERSIRDFLIRTSDLRLEGVAVTPERGDKIIQTLGGVAYEWEVNGPGGEKPSRWVDDAGHTTRIHTKLVAVGSPDLETT